MQDGGKMNFSSFGTSFPTIQFTTSNIELTPSSTMTTAIQQSSQIDQEINRYQNSSVNMTSFNQTLISTTTVPTKFQNDDATEHKYNSNPISVPQQFSNISYPPATQEAPIEDKRLVANTINYTPTTQSQPQQISQDICSALLQQQNCESKKVIVQNPSWQTLPANSTVADYLSNLPASTLPLSLHHFLKYSAENIKKEASNTVQTEQSVNINNLSTITIPQHQIQHTQVGPIQSQIQQPQIQQESQRQTHIPCQPITTITTNTTNNNNNNNNNSQLPQTNEITTNSDITRSLTILKKPKKKKRRKIFKERKPKPKPGEIRLTTALDGSLLYMCPECQVAYPERALLEIHLVGHNLERRFVCDICNAALKRKDHLTRHKQSHNPERPFICTVCLKAFKRKEQLSLHFVIHSGEKRHVCMECGKGFYRKDHLRKHTRSHIARRVKAELNLQNQNNNNGNNNNNNELSEQNNETITSEQQVISIN